MRRRKKQLTSGTYVEIERHLTVNLAGLNPLRVDKIHRRDIARELAKYLGKFATPGRGCFHQVQSTQLDAVGVAIVELAGEPSEAVLETVLAPLPEVATGAGAAVVTGAGVGGCTPIEIGCSG
jgi:hypothetical protein